MRLRKVAVVVIGLVVLLAVLTWLDIRLMSSRMVFDGSVAASHSPTGASPAVSVTALHVEGNDRLQCSLQARLNQVLADLPGIGDVTVTGRRTAQPGSALVAVSFVERQVFWTPLYSRSQLHVHVAYASDGDISFDDGGEVTRFKSAEGDPPTVRFLASYALADVTWGLVSQPGYQDYLAEQIASRVKASIEEQIKKG